MVMAAVSPLTLVRASAHCCGVRENDIVALPPVNCAPEGSHSTESPEKEKTPPCVAAAAGTAVGSSGVTDTVSTGCPAPQMGNKKYLLPEITCPARGPVRGDGPWAYACGGQQAPGDRGA